MAHLVRSSKVRHVYAKPEKRDACFDGIRVTKVTWDSLFCAANTKFVAVLTEAAGGGAFIVIPVNKAGKIEMEYPHVTGHKAAVLDIAWCPFNDNIIASGSDDCTVKVWEIPDGGLKEPLTEPIVSLDTIHQRRVGQVLWHPTANNVLLSAGGDPLIILWNVGTGEALVQIDCHPDVIYGVDFNPNGSKIVTTCKDKIVRVIDARTGEVLEKGKGHDGGKPQRCIYLRDGRILTTGFSRMSERQYALRDETMLDNPIHQAELDQSNAPLLPIYDSDLNMVYLVGKGDSAIRYFEINMDQPPFIHYINTFGSNKPQRGIGVMPKRGLDISSCEVFRLYKVHADGIVEPLKFVCPRKSDLFQADLYPDTAGDVPALTAEEWFDEKKDANPILISLDNATPKAEKKPTAKLNKLAAKPNKLAQRSNKPAAGETTKVDAPDGDAKANAAPAIAPAEFDLILERLERLEKKNMKQELRISDLERQLAAGNSEANGIKHGNSNGVHA